MSKKVIRFLLLLSLLCSCKNEEEVRNKLNAAENLIENYPDSAYTVLESIDKEKINGRKERAGYSLLMSMALDKRYIDTTTFEILQPALDYFIKEGTADEKLRTYYYQGVIYLNRGDLNNAFGSFLKGEELFRESRDSLTMARLLAAQGVICNEIYDFKTSSRKFMESAGIYAAKGMFDKETDLLLSTLNDLLITDNRNLSDSVLGLISSKSNLTRLQKNKLKRQRISYGLKYGDREETLKLLQDSDIKIEDENDVYNYSRALIRVGYYKEAESLLNGLQAKGQPYDTLRYLSLIVPALEGQGKDREALSGYRQFAAIQDRRTLQGSARTIGYIQERHLKELETQKELLSKTRTIWIYNWIILLFIVIVVILILLARNRRIKKMLYRENLKKQEIENRRLKSESEKLELQKKNAELERDRKIIEAENLSLRIKDLENEYEKLKGIKGEKFPEEIRETIRQRMEMLNSHLAGLITSNAKHERSYDSILRSLMEDRQRFMDSTRMAFMSTHPGFIGYLEEKGLTVEEINYVCLYALGLNGREVGEYLRRRSHVNTSVEIRKKLGLNKNDTNIGIYIRGLMGGI